MTKHAAPVMWFVFSFAVVSLPGAAVNAADVFLESRKSEFEKIPIWVMGFADHAQGRQDDTGIGKQVEAILKADLQRTHLFEVVDQSTETLPLSESGCREQAPIVKAKESLAPVVTWGRVGRKGEKLVMDVCAYDGGEIDLIALGKRYTGGPMTMRVLRSMVHRWTDELVSHYTGTPGIARTKIMYVSEEKTGDRNLFVMDYDGFGPKRVTADRQLSLMPAWTPDQHSIVYTTYRHNTQEIVWLTLSKGSRRLLVPPQTLNMTPAVSPNGRFLAYASARKGNSDLFMMNLSSGSKQQLTDDRSADLSPAWAPDGKTLAFTSDRSGRPQIYLMQADGSGVRRLTYEGRYNSAPAWSPLGDWIAYVCLLPGDGFKLCRVSPDGQRRVQMTKGPSREIDDSPSWAPDGRHVVFSSTRGGLSHIYMMYFDGTGLEQLTKGGIHHSSPAWSPGRE